LTVSGVESFLGELGTLRADNARLRRLLQLSEEQARAAASDQATLTGAPASPVTMGSNSADKVRFFFELFRCRTDIYALHFTQDRPDDQIRADPLWNTVGYSPKPARDNQDAGTAKSFKREQ
jgi:hypothetical protein